MLTFLTLVFVILALPDADSQASAAFLTVWLTFWSFGCAMLVGNVVKSIRHKTIAAAIFSGLFALPFLAGEVAGLFFLATAAGPVNVALMLVLWALLPWFYHLLKAPTYAGRRIMDEIEGFKMFLSIGEKERLNLLHPPDRTPELWERFLPYAVALDVENQWAEQFTSVLDSAAVSDAGYSPAWYAGSSLAGGFHAGTFASTLGSSLTSAVSSSSATPVRLPE